MNVVCHPRDAWDGRGDGTWKPARGGGYGNQDGSQGGGNHRKEGDEDEKATLLISHLTECLFSPN